MRTRFTDLVGCALPLQLAAMGRIGTTELAAAVTAAGGLGMVPMAVEPGPEPCGINFLMPFVPAPDAVAGLVAGGRVAEFFFGEPDPALVAAAHSASALAAWQVGSAGEAAAAERAGCDFVVAQGVEAGGHVRGTRPLDELLPDVLAAVGVPVVAAGGIATAERVAALIGAGADAVRVGTRFATCPESGAHPGYVAALLAAGGADTVLTGWFDEGWPDAPHRVLRSCLEAARPVGGRSPVPPARDAGDGYAAMAMYAGAGVGEVTASLPAAEVVADLVRLL